ncbi:MAG: hypothetical protein E4H40_08500 [Candidatus Brocadiia bacterium]|nr:MAG: hypothetical protein E4H40_08500 [Candidatus Brocadiia bacterium]
MLENRKAQSCRRADSVGEVSADGEGFAGIILDKDFGVCAETEFAASEVDRNGFWDDIDGIRGVRLGSAAGLAEKNQNEEKE